MKKFSIKEFRTEIYSYYRGNKRQFPWRETTDPYKILVSEVMLQQTQAGRVIEKYEAFIKRFPNFKTLAGASMQDILLEWQGLGYNRRALSLKRIAFIVEEKYEGELPQSLELLDALPGIGKATASSIIAFVSNYPSVFIETNIRSVYIHFFFKGESKVADSDIFRIVRKTLDRENPREWYYALMDYGAMIKKQAGNPNRRSIAYAKQPKFRGSDREVRGALVRMLAREGKMNEKKLRLLPFPSEKVEKNLSTLIKEGFFIKSGKEIHV